MSRSSYGQSLHKVLQPLGFRRKGSDWIRVRGDMWECVNLQTSSVAGVTANIEMKDLETERILQSIPCEAPIFMSPVSRRIGQLIDGYDKWWKNDSLGPAELVEAVQAYALPWFEKVRSLGDQAAQWYGRGGDRPWRSPSNVVLAVTLYRMGELAEARALFETPPPKTAVPSFVARARCVQRWLESEGDGQGGASKPTSH